MLVVLPLWLEGAVAGAASLVGAMTVEVVYLYWASRTLYAELPAHGGERATCRQLRHFSWPLVISVIT
jgi:hypothetical protein